MTKRKPKTGVVMQVSPRVAKTIKKIEGGEVRRDYLEAAIYDWRDFVGPADKIVEEVKRPVLRKLPEKDRRASTIKSRAGMDLGPKREALARLLAEAAEVHQVALDDWQARRPENRLDSRLEKNWDQNEPGVPYDYSKYVDEVGDGLPDWDEWWQQVYNRGPGGTGVGYNNLPTEPLHPVRALVGQWWREHVGPRFDPRYPVAYEGARRDENRDMPLYQPAARLLLLVAKTLNEGYSATNCNGLRETRKKQRRRRRSE